MHKRLLLLGAAALLVGCDDPFPDIENGGEDPDGDVELTQIWDDCSTSSNAWHYAAETNGWTGPIAELQITQNTHNAWHEDHDLPSVDHDPDGSWDRLERDLGIVSTASAQQSNVSTLFGCELKSEMMWMIRIWDYDGNFSDCAVWHGGNGDVSVFDTHGCLDWS